MTRLAIIFSLLFVTPAWAGEVDGNSFFCSDPRAKDQAILFEDDKVKHMRNKRFITGDYNVFLDTVNWNDGVGSFRLNRKTLELLDMHHNLRSVTLQCKFMEFSEALNLIEERDKRRKLEAKKGYQF